MTSLPMPEPLGIDTSLTGGGVGTGIDGIDAPQFEAGLPVPDFSNWQEVFGQNGPRQGMFTNLVNDSANLPKGDGSLRSRIIEFGKQFVGMPYKWGGSSPSTSFDCSGLIQYVAKQFGLNLPRISYQQATSGRRISISQARPGDLIAWDNSSRNNGADHVVMYAGNGMVLEAARTGTKIRIRKLSKSEMSSGWGVALTYPGENSPYSKGGQRPI